MIPFEFHITTPADQIEKAGELLKCRVHSFHNISSLGEAIDDNVTHQKAEFTSHIEAQNFLEANVKLLKEAKIIVLRSKIETVPWYNLAQPNPLFQYFETHVRVYTDSYRTLKPWLLSINRLSLTKTMTLRTQLEVDKGSFAHHRKLLDLHIPSLVSLNVIPVGKPDTEFVIFDSNRKHDERWER